MVTFKGRPRGELNPKMALSYLSTNLKDKFLQRCGEEFDRVISRTDAMIREMDLRYKYKYGQVVKMTSNTSIMDNVMGVPKITYGIIVGHSDFESLSGNRSYYRVYLSDRNPFLGRDEDCLEPVLEESEVPDEFLLSEVSVQARIGGKGVKAICVFSTTV